ncbi:MAG: hypothetical protein L0Y71_08710 [Gemmataceae bacterium]|nr:hypothetical protein [Gemmataceae bacterium]
MVRILLAGVLGGAVAFVCGAIEHMVFQWQGRTFKSLPDDAALMEFLKKEAPDAGIYAFPDPAGADQDDKAYAELNERYKKGPNGILLIGPTGEDMMGPKQLGLEALSVILVALIAAWIVSLLAPGTDYLQRVGVVLLIGVAAWLSISVSHGIWYRFPDAYVRDELLCALFEWGVAGLVIAAIARPPAASTPTSTPT